MKKITKDSVLNWKGIEKIRNLDLNVVEDYMTDGLVLVKYEVTPIVQTLLSSYCASNAFKVLHDGKEISLVGCNLSQGYENLELLCKNSDNDLFKIKYTNDMVIQLTCTNVDLKVSILKFKAMYEMEGYTDQTLLKLLELEK